MTTKLILREATSADVPGMLEAYLSGFGNDPFVLRCFPQSDPAVREHRLKSILKQMDDPSSRIMVALLPPSQATQPIVNRGQDNDDDEPMIVGWTRWVRITTLPPPVVFTPDMYPFGERELAARFYQVHNDARRRIVGDEPHWQIGPIVTRQEFQRQRVGAALMQWGVEKADEDGWMAYVTGSPDGKRLYERFGFQVVERTVIEDLDVEQFYMKRPARVKTGTLENEEVKQT